MPFFSSATTVVDPSAFSSAALDESVAAKKTAISRPISPCGSSRSSREISRRLRCDQRSQRAARAVAGRQNGRPS